MEQEKHQTHGRTLAARLIKLNDDVEVQTVARLESETMQQRQKDREEALQRDLELAGNAVIDAQRAHSVARTSLGEAQVCGVKWCIGGHSRSHTHTRIHTHSSTHSHALPDA